MPGKKRKISYLKRSVFWPCGSCRRNCISDCIFCNCCKSWYHHECENLSTEDFSVFSKTHLPFTCLTCLQDEVGVPYSYDAALLRMKEAAKNGFQTAYCVAKREALFLPALYIEQTEDTIDHQIDHNAALLMEKYVPGSHGSPLYTSQDGNCFFHALSTALYGNEQHSTELRLRTCVELFRRKEVYLAHPSIKDIKIISPDFEEACVDCACSGSYSSTWTMMAAADATGTAIRSWYPNVNGPKDKVHRILHDVLFTPSENKDKDSYPEVIILWRKIGPRGSIWTPNHFVPIRLNPTFINTTEAETVSNNDSKTHRQVNFTLEQVSLHEVSMKEMEEIEESLQIPADTETFSHTVVSHSSFEDDDMDYNSHTDSLSFADVSTSTKHSETPVRDPPSDRVPFMKPTPDGGLDAEELYRQITERSYVYNEIPPGRKDNMFFLIDNSKNMERKLHGKKNQFIDDLGVWDTLKGNTVKTYYVVDKNSLRTVFLKNGEYCVQKMQKKKRTFIPLEPQPDESTVIAIHKYYTNLKRQNNYKRRITWIENHRDASFGNVALVEYFGILNSTESSHGNAKNTSEIYHRTDPKIMEKAAEKLKYKKPREVYREMVEDDSILAPKNYQQLRDLKHRQKVKSGTQHGANIADDMLHVMDMLTNNPYVQKVEQSKNHVPTIFLYHDDQILDMIHFLKNANEPRVGVDRTFNLGCFYVTTLVYKNERVVRKDTQTHPVFLGPVMLHKEATYTVYHSFFSHIRARLATGISDIDIRLPEKMEFGSDAEKALTKAIDDCFPNANRKLCTKHLKDNLSDYLKNRVGVTSSVRRDMLDRIFGKEGIVSANDTFQFEERCVAVKDLATNSQQFVDYFDKQFKPKLAQYVYRPKGQDRMWTNNDSESMNNIFKIETDWKPQDTPSLIQKISNVIKLQFLDLKRALCGTGNYRLAASYRKFRIEEAMYRSKSKEERAEMFQKFLRSQLKERNPEYITSTDGRLRVVNKAKGTARKPGQRKRPRSEKTKPRHN